MADRKSRRVKRWKTLEEELAVLAKNPTAQALLQDLEQQDPERVEQLLSELHQQAEEEEPEP